MTQNRITVVESLSIFFGTASGLATLTGLILNHTPIGILGTAGVAGSLTLMGAANRHERITKLELETRTATASASHLTTRLEGMELDNRKLLGYLQPYRAQDGGLIDIEAVNAQVSALTHQLDKMRQAYEDASQGRLVLERDYSTIQQERDALARELAGLTESNTATVQAWSTQFDEQNAEITRLEAQVRDLDIELAKHRDHKELLVQTETHATRQRLQDAVERLQAMELTAETMSVDIVGYRDNLAEIQTTLSDLLGNGYQSVLNSHNESVQGLVAQIQRLSEELRHCQMPRKFGVPGEFERADNLIDLLAADGVLTDANELVPNGDGSFTCYLNVRDRTVLSQAYVDELTKRGDWLATQCHCIEPLTFSMDRVNPFRVSTVMRHSARPKLASKDVSRLWRTAEQFTSTASKWHRLRITGGSESGKSPLAELVLSAIMHSNPTAEYSLAFPFANSRKNHWSIPVTHNTAKSLADDLLDRAERRGKGLDRTSHLVTGIIDEVDTALSDDSSLAPMIKELVKTGSHSNVGVILLGQNANVSNYRGMQRTDLENMVSVHIGANAKHAIENSALSDEEKAKLKAKATKLTDYCESQNNDLDPEADADKLSRFALVMEPGKSPYFIELPRFGSAVVPASHTVVMDVVSNEQVSCPYCGGTHHSKNGTNRMGHQRYKCKNSACGKAFTVPKTGVTHASTK